MGFVIHGGEAVVNLRWLIVMELTAEERASHGYELMVMIAGLEWHGWKLLWKLNGFHDG